MDEFTKNLGFPLAGQRNRTTGNINEGGKVGYIWSAVPSSYYARRAAYTTNSGNIDTEMERSFGYPIRCIQAK